MDLSRRRFIQTTPILATGLAGCSSNGNNSNSNNNDDSDANVVTVNENTERPDSDNDGVPDVQDDYPNDRSRSEQIRTIDDTRNIEEDAWRYYSVELPQSGTLSYDFIVREGPAIDVILLNESEYQYFDEGERWQYHTDLSALDSAGDEVQGQLSAGNYRLIFDNSSRGEASPPTDFSNNVVSVEFNIELSR
jgi:hypothetical protein